MWEKKIKYFEKIGESIMVILLCGGAGYIGSHVNKALSREGHSVIVFDNLINGHCESVKWGSFEKGDLLKLMQLEKIFIENSIDVVVHLAAYAYVGESVTDPEKYYYNNVVATLNLLQIMKKYDCKRIIFSSTCATYGIPERVPISEGTQQNPINPYGASKLMIERIFQDYHKAYGMEYVVFRYFNAAGADPDCEIGESHDPETHLIPLVLETASGYKTKITVFGTDYDTRDGSCIRDYIHVADLADAHLLAINYLADGGKSDFFNLGNDCGISVLEIIDAAKRITGKSFQVSFSKRREGDPAVLVGDSQKVRNILGWKPRYSEIDTIISHAWRWYQNRKY